MSATLGRTWPDSNRVSQRGVRVRPAPTPKAECSSWHSVTINPRSRAQTAGGAAEAGRSELGDWRWVGRRPLFGGFAHVTVEQTGHVHVPHDVDGGAAAIEKPIHAQQERDVL